MMIVPSKTLSQKMMRKVKVVMLRQKNNIGDLTIIIKKEEMGKEIKEH